MPTDNDQYSRRSYLATVTGATAVGLAGCINPLGGEPEEPVEISVETVVEGISHPWGIEFFPGEDTLVVTERNGTVLLVDILDSTTRTIAGTPDVFAQNQGGMLDVTRHPDYPEEEWIYLTYSALDVDGGGEPDNTKSTTHVGRGRLDALADQPELEDFEVLHAAEPFIDSNGHFGSRLAFDPDEYLYVTVGDRQFKDFGPEHVSQDRGNELGATLRLNPDGSIPDDNPFLDDPEAMDSIYSYGHRNAQGMTVHPETGDIWQSEHGEQDGDELNVIEAGGNYGWPIAHFGCTYGTGEPIGDDPDEREDVVDPVHYWECNTGGFPPAGITFYDGEAFPDWTGDLFVGNLAGEYLGWFAVDGLEVTECDPLLADRSWRIRDVAVGPETGYLYVAVDASNGTVARLEPA